MNRVNIAGRLTRDIELRKTQSNLSVAGFTLAVDNPFAKDERNKAFFIDCTAWKQSAEFLAKYAKKGSFVLVDGSLQTRTYDKDGRTVKVTEVLCDHVELAPQQRREEGHPAGQAAYEAPAAEEPKENPFSVDPDDLPFF